MRDIYKMLGIPEQWFEVIRCGSRGACFAGGISEQDFGDEKEVAGEGQFLVY